DLLLGKPAILMHVPRLVDGMIKLMNDNAPLGNCDIPVVVVTDPKRKGRIDPFKIVDTHIASIIPASDTHFRMTHYLLRHQTSGRVDIPHASHPSSEGRTGNPLNNKWVFGGVFFKQPP